MARKPRCGKARGLLVGLAVLSATPAASFEIFGIHLWGPREDENTIEVIDPLPYRATLHVTGGEESLQGRLENASALYTDREQPASGRAGLLAKGRADYRRILAALYAAGYYGPEISIQAMGREVSDLTLSDELPPNVTIHIRIAAGPQFLFGRTEIVNAPPAEVSHEDEDENDTPAAIDFEPGQPALSGVINQASAISIERWRQLARAKAKETDREVIADHSTNRLDVTLSLEPGPRAYYGPTHVSGSRRVDPDFIAFMTDLPQGRPFDPDDVQASEDRLNRLGVFRSIRIEEAPEIGPDGSLPMTVTVEDRRPRTIGFGATLSTIDGAGIAAYWQHRNLFGRAERLRFDASIDGLGESADPDDYDYNFGVTFTKPGVWTPDTNFITSAVARQLDFTTYRERSITGRVGISQMFGDRLTGELFAEISRARYEDDFGTRNFTTYALVGSAAYDRRNDPLNATEGYYLAAEFRPFYEANFGNVAARGTLEGRAYHGFGEEDKVVLAGRAKVGSYVGADASESPPDLLFFAGGGGSIRGYEYRSIGVDSFNSEGEPIVIGGRGLFEASAEIRYRFTRTMGAVGFVDSGFVSEDPTFGGENRVQTGAGLGFRYYTSIGVLRADLAAPVNPRPEDSAVALYIGIGQAF